MKKYISEFMGTFALVFCGAGAMTVNEAAGSDVTHVGVAITCGLIIMVMMYVFEEILEAQVTPGSIIAFAHVREFTSKEYAKYVSMQLVDVFLAVLSCKFVKNEYYLHTGS